MTGDIKPEQILSEQEIASLSLLQEAYSGLAKQEAGSLARILELEPEAEARLIGQLTLKLVDLNFEERKKIVDGLRSIISALNTAVDLNGEPVVSLVAVAEDGSAELSLNPAETSEADQDLPESPKFTRAQRTFLNAVFGEENLDKAKALDLAGRERLVKLITDLYESLQIPRITSESKYEKITVVRMMMAGKTYKEIVEVIGKNDNVLQASLRTMISQITSMVPQEDLIKLIDQAASGEVIELPVPKPTEPESDQPTSLEEKQVEDQEVDKTPASPLTPEQKTWIGRVFGEELTDRIEAFNESARTKLIEVVAENYASLKIRRITPEGKVMRVASLRMLMHGDSYQDMAAALGGTDTNIYRGLLTMAESITSRISREELAGFIELAETEAATEATADHDSSELGSATVEEPGTNDLELGLGPEPTQWYYSLFEDEEPVAYVSELSSGQRARLAELLGYRLNANIVTRYGGEATRARVRRMQDFLSGTPLEQIALEFEMNVDEIKNELKNDAQSLKNRIEKIDLVRLVLEAQAFKPAEE